MAFKIGFSTDITDNTQTPAPQVVLEHAVMPKPSVVQVRFEERDRTLSYYNDQFDLQCGDIVYVEGKLEGLRGDVVDVNYNFKIKLSDYKRVISVADTNVSGQFFFAGSHYMTFERNTLPPSKVRTWFFAPEKDTEVFVGGSDDKTFTLDNLGGISADEAMKSRGYNYYLTNRVRYISVDSGKGYAIVEGSRPYEVEFTYQGNAIGGMLCSCYCGGACKHEFAAMLELRDMLKCIEENYPQNYQSSDYFAAVSKRTLFEFAIINKKTGSFIL